MIAEKGKMKKEMLQIQGLTPGCSKQRQWKPDFAGRLMRLSQGQANLQRQRIFFVYYIMCASIMQLA